MINWNDTSYQRIKDANIINDNLVVSFENGDLIEVSKETLTPYSNIEFEWRKLSFNPFEIIIPGSPHALEIPWDKLRVITDKKFGKYLAEKAEEQSKLIGVKVKRLREKKGISSKELAERAGISPQTISRIEQGHNDVSFSTLRKILAAMGCSLIDIANEETYLENENTKKNLNFLMKRLSYAGIDSNLFTQKIIPAKLQVALKSNISNIPSLLVDEVASYITAIYGWSSNELWNSPILVVKPDPFEMAFFKKPTSANENQVKAYSHYAYYLAKVVSKTLPTKRDYNYPESIEEFKEKYFKKYQRIDLAPLLDFVWNMGVCVLPLNDSGVFHGASWNIDGRHTIVLKQRTNAHARWIFDLLHELYHVFAHLDKENTSVVETEELNPFSNNDSIEELEANSFANQFIFGNRAEELAEQCVIAAKWEIKNLSKAVVKVANIEKIREDFLSNYLAYRLSFQGENWWGSAIKMQITEPNPFTLTSDLLQKKIQIQKLSPMDYNLLSTAITNSKHKYHEKENEG